MAALAYVIFVVILLFRFSEWYDHKVKVNFFSFSLWTESVNWRKKMWKIYATLNFVKIRCYRIHRYIYFSAWNLWVCFFFGAMSYAWCRFVYVSLFYRLFIMILLLFFQRHRPSQHIHKTANLLIILSFGFTHIFFFLISSFIKVSKAQQRERVRPRDVRTKWKKNHWRRENKRKTNLFGEEKKKEFIIESEKYVKSYSVQYQHKLNNNVYDQLNGGFSCFWGAYTHN